MESECAGYTNCVKTVLGGLASIDLYLWFAGNLIVLCLFFLFETVAVKHRTTNVAELDGKLTSCAYN